MKSNAFFAIFLFLVASQFADARSIVAQDPFDLPRFMDKEPKFVEVVPYTVFSSELLPIWLEALNSETIELQRKAGETIVLAQSRGMKGLEKAKNPLLKRFQQADLHRSVRAAVAKALIAIDAKDSAGEFAKQLDGKNDFELQSICEPAIAAWKSDVLLKAWLKRIPDSNLGNQKRILAIRGVAQLNDKSAVDLLSGLVSNQVESFAIRFEAAKALGKLSQTGQTEIATTLSESTSVTDRLIGVYLLQSHRDPDSKEQLLKFAKDVEPAVAHIAWQSLLDSSEPRLLDSVVDFGVSNKDYRVRVKSIELMKLWKNAVAVEKMGLLLNDVHPEVRQRARQVLIGFAAEKELLQSVLVAADSALDMKWQGIQQGLLVLSTLDHKPTADVASNCHCSIMSEPKCMSRRRGRLNDFPLKQHFRRSMLSSKSMSRRSNRVKAEHILNLNMKPCHI